MRAVTINDGDLMVEERPDPEPGPGQILVAVRAAGLNGADMLQRTGGYPAPPGSPPDIPGPRDTTSPASSSPGMSGGDPGGAG